jgi:hypothetical protein
MESDGPVRELRLAVTAQDYDEARPKHLVLVASPRVWLDWPRTADLCDGWKAKGAHVTCRYSRAHIAPDHVHTGPLKIRSRSRAGFKRS